LPATVINKTTQCIMEDCFNPYRTNVESHSTAPSAVPGPMSNSNRQATLQCFVSVLPKRLLSSGCF